MPTRDVQVRYQSEDPTMPGASPGSPPRGDCASRRGAARGHAGGHRGGGAFSVLEAEREFHDLGRIASVLVAPYQPTGSNRRLRREGTDRVAGQACTVWRIDPPAGEEDEVKRACITADGVPLRLVTGEGSEAETDYVATEVSYAPQDPARFRVPQGYRPLNLNAPAQRR
jgi:hypothetical protein